MNELESRIRAAIRAAVGTVLPDGVPPLRQPDDDQHRFGDPAEEMATDRNS